MSLLKFQSINLNDRILVIDHNGQFLGDCSPDAIGRYYWTPGKECSWWGQWPANILREIADKLDELNDAWDQEVKRGLAQALSEHLHGDDDTSIEWPG